MSTCLTIIQTHGSLILALFLAGLTGGFTHCAGMCGPFVMGQACARLDKVPAARMREWHRLAGAALLPYHAGRMTTYVLLGVMVTLFSSRLHDTAVFNWISAGLLAIAAILFIRAGLGHTSRITHHPSRITNLLTVISRPLFADPRGWKGYSLGILLGFLPCGLVYAALAAAASAGDIAAAAFGMAAFALGTVPALAGIAFGSRWAMRRWQPQLKKIARGIMLANGAVLLVIAGGMVW